MADVIASTDGGLKRLFNKPNFDAEKFIARVSANGGTDILRTINNLNQMADDASNKMKLAIFNNFRLFIEAGKAVSSLGATMHQLDNCIIEQKRICSTLAEKSLFSDDSSSVPANKQQSDTSDLSSMLNSVEGVPNLLKNVNRQLLFEADATELNSTTHLRVSYTHLFVLTDYVLFTKRSTDMKESHKYQKQSLYEIENVTAISMTVASQKTQLNLVQILVFPDIRLLQFESLKDKRGFLAALEEAKRIHVSTVSGDSNINALLISPNLESCLGISGAISNSGMVEMQSNLASRNPVVCSSEVENICLEAIIGTIPETAAFIYDKKPIPDKRSGRHQNPFQDDTSFIGPIFSSVDAWLLDVPEDVDVAVAIRDFSLATKLISKSRRRLSELINDVQAENSAARRPIQGISDKFMPPDAAGSTKGRESCIVSLPSLRKLSDRIEHRVSNLSLVLEDEIRKAADRHGSSLSVRATVLYLSDLGKTVIAIHLFLAYRSNLLNKKLTRGVRQEGNQLIYLNKLSLTFHQQLVETVNEWNQLIASLSSREEFHAFQDFIASKLCSWILEETVKFCNQLKVVLVESRSISFYTMACATERIHAHAARIAEIIGVDITSTLNSCMLKSWHRAAEEQLRVYKDALQHRISKENWQGFSDDKLETQIKTMCDIGFAESKHYFTGGKRLASFTLQSARSLSYFVQACLRFDTPELADCFTGCISNILDSELAIYRSLLENENLSKNSTTFQTVLCNFDFFANIVVPRMITSLNLKDHPDVKISLRSYKKLLRQAEK